MLMSYILEQAYGSLTLAKVNFRQIKPRYTNPFRLKFSPKGFRQIAMTAEEYLRKVVWGLRYSTAVIAILLLLTGLGWQKA